MSKRLTFLITLVSLSAAALAQAPREIHIKVNPTVLKPVNGKFPSAISLAVYADNCDGSTPDMTNYKFTISGGYLTSSGKFHGGPCGVIDDAVTVDANTQAGEYVVSLLDDGKKIVGHGTLSVLDSTAGSTPPGLAPQVDVMWNVMSFKNCADAFGRRVAQALYCIQVKMGNNSGYPIQIAGMGFSRKLKTLAKVSGIDDEAITIANNSYASTRAILVHAQSVSTRNIIYSVLQSSGLIMAATSPFFNRPNPKKNFLALSNIVNGPLQQAFNLIAPDPIVRQLGNLDDQTFRDNAVIANNAHAQTVVFVEKEALTQSLQELSMQLGAIAKPEPSATLAQTTTAAAKQRPLFEDEAKRATEISRRPSGIKSWRLGSQSPFLVKLALGDLVIVGDQIAYVQRVQISSSASGNPVAVTISPTKPSVQVSKTVQFSATVTGSSTTSVTWSVKCSQGGAACGAIDDKGLYTAPSNGPNPNDVTVTATSTADTTKSSPTDVSITPALTLTPASLPDGKVGAAYSVTIQAAGGSGNYSYSVTSGTLPPGLVINSVGVISGIPTAATVGTPAGFTVTATDATTSDRTGSATWSIKVAPASN